jgi:GNAT superfamily N-acetyltransferase
MIYYREMTSDDIPAGLALCRASRWNQVRRDWELFLQLSPHGCRVAVHDGRVVGTVTTVSYQARFSWIGMVLVEPDARGQGIGTQLLREALAVLQDEQSIRLDATPAGRPVYRKLGFVDEYGLSRMETVVNAVAFPAKHNAARPMTEADLPQVGAMDAAIFGADRRAVLAWLLAGAPELAWVFPRAGRIAGYTFGRHGFNFVHLGPVVAEDTAAAQQLVTACLQQQAGRSLILDAPQHTPEWRSWLESVGFVEQRPFIRMFYGAIPYSGVPEKQFAILGPEFG